MTDRQRQMIDAYIPGDPDPQLDFAEYYRQDCLHDTHWMYDNWERLRDLQQEELNR